MFLCELDGCIRRKRQKPGLTLERFEELFRAFLLETYHRRISEEGRLAPSARWEEGGFLSRMPESLEQLDLLLMQEVRARKVRRDGIHFQGLRYLSLTLAAYVGEDVTICFDPRDMGEVRVFYKDRFLCPAESAEVAGETIPLRDVLRVRNQRRRELSAVLQDRQKVVDALLQLKRGTAPKEIHANTAVLPVSGVRIKKVPRRVVGRLSKQLSTTGSLNSAKPAANSDTSGFAMDRPGSARRCRPYAIAAQIRSSHVIRGQVKCVMTYLQTRCDTQPRESTLRRASETISTWPERECV